MPNHIHGIIITGENEYNSDGGVGALGIDADTNAHRDAMHRVSTNTQTNTQKTNLARNVKIWHPLFVDTNLR